MDKTNQPDSAEAKLPGQNNSQSQSNYAFDGKNPNSQSRPNSASDGILQQNQSSDIAKSPAPALWLQEKFRQYYANARPQIQQVEKREFGFGSWEKKIEFRHLSFENPQSLWLRLRKDAPLYVSCSAAYYEFPANRPMANKHWLGADLIFDLDAEPDELSPFILNKTLEGVRSKAITLIEDFLIPDFGISKDELLVNFSGSRGYHVRAYHKDSQSLGRAERREIVDYIEGAGLAFEDFFSEEFISDPDNAHRHFSKLIGPRPDMGGYKGKFARRVIRMLNDSESAARISPMLKNADNVQRLISGIEKGNWSAVQIPHATERFKEIFMQTSLRLTNQVETDANVTIDTSKILRLPDSIHGGSGMLAKTIPPAKKLEEFSPLIDALAFSMKKFETVRTLRKIPAQEFGGQAFDEIPFAKEIGLPEAYAIYLVCKKAAVPAIQ